MVTESGVNQMDLQMPVVVLLILANLLWLFVGYAKGFTEGKAEGLRVAAHYQRVSENAR